MQFGSDVGTGQILGATEQTSLDVYVYHVYNHRELAHLNSHIHTGTALLTHVFKHALTDIFSKMVFTAVCVLELLASINIVTPHEM